jgi:GTPase
VPFAEGARVAELHEVAGDLEREDTAHGVLVKARVTPTLAERYARYAVASDGAAGNGSAA